MIIGAKILFCVISIVSLLVILALTLVLVTQHAAKPSILSSPATTSSAAAPSRLPSGKTEGYKYVLYWNEAYGTKGGLKHCFSK